MSLVMKCRMCGGNVVFEQGDTYGTCDSCGSTVAIPKVSDESRLNLFNRADAFRRRSDFDKAVDAYEKILGEDDTDAEAHWGLLLSRYGIEYIEDPSSHERIPTCHRVQPDSILSDPDYLAALEHAPDPYVKSLYEKEAKRIAQIQRDILAISNKETPYDVFICYKETDEGGSRTKDSVLAQEIYYELTDEKYKVFFSRITLEDKLGTQYEPYIFAALHSAKVMLVVGTKPEYFNAVWVKNEWSRFLSLMKTDKSKLIIPCYRDMDPYELPDELSIYQSQDMSKIGFMQDLLHGVKKVLNEETVTTPTKSSSVPHPGASPSVVPLCRRAYLFCEDGDFQKAASYADRVLDLDPEYADAYFVKVLCRFECVKPEDLKSLPNEETLASDKNFQKAIRFGGQEQKDKWSSIQQALRARDEVRLKRYEDLCNELSAVYSEPDLSVRKQHFLQLAQKFDQFGSYKDAKNLAAKCRVYGSDEFEELFYKFAQNLVDQAENASLSTKRDWCLPAIKAFEMLGSYKNSTYRHRYCQKMLKMAQRFDRRGDVVPQYDEKDVYELFSQYHFKNDDQETVKSSESAPEPANSESSEEDSDQNVKVVVKYVDREPAYTPPPEPEKKEGGCLKGCTITFFVVLGIISCLSAL